MDNPATVLDMKHTNSYGILILATHFLDMTLNNLMAMALVMLELWVMWSIFPLPSLTGPLLPGVVALTRSYLWVNYKLLTFKLCTYDKLKGLKLNC